MRKLHRIRASVRVSVRMNIKANAVIIAMTRKIKDEQFHTVQLKLLGNSTNDKSHIIIIHIYV